MLVKTSELTGAALDWTVAQCEGVLVVKYSESRSLFYGNGFDKYKPSTDWGQGGPIIEKSKIKSLYGGPLIGWECCLFNADSDGIGYDQNLLVAAMRCYVNAKLGDVVDVPKELI